MIFIIRVNGDLGSGGESKIQPYFPRRLENNR